MTDEMKAKRDYLKGLSKIASKLVQAEQADTVNDALLSMYKEQGHTEIHSFKKWLELGYVVRRGEKALLLWGKPQKGLNQEKETEGEKDEFKFFPLAYVFSQQQVEKLNSHAKA